MKRTYGKNYNQPKKIKPGKKILRLLLLLLTLLAMYKGLSFIVSKITSADYFNIEKVTIIAPPEIDYIKIEQALNLKGKNIFYVSNKIIEPILKQEPWIKQFHLKKSFPNKVEIIIDAKEGCAIAKQETSLFYIDCEGQVIDKFRPGFKNELIILSASKENMPAAIKFLKIFYSINSEKIYINPKSISDIKAESAEIFKISLNNTNESILIKADNLEEKLIQIQKVISDLSTKNEHAKIIDATLPYNKIVVRF